MSDSAEKYAVEIMSKVKQEVFTDGGTVVLYRMYLLRDVQQMIVDTYDRAVPMLLWCPQCGERHIDAGEFATKSHHTHACQECGHVWRPAIVATVGVKYLPGFKDGAV